MRNGVVNMAKWKSLRVRQELVEEIKKEVERSKHQSLSEFISEAIQLRLQTLTKERVSEYLERDKYSRIPQLQAQLFYTPKHIWAQATPQGTVRIGVTDYFKDQVKDIVNIQTNKTDDNVSKEEPFGVVETWWFTHDLYSPLDGKIVSVNKTISDDPFTLNADPHQWIVEIQPLSTVDSWMNGLLGFEEYKKVVTNLEGRLH